MTEMDALTAMQSVIDPEVGIDIVNLGLGSETVSGLSEPDHPYPRPDLHERIDALRQMAERL